MTGFEMVDGHLVFPDDGKWREHEAPEPAVIEQPEEEAPRAEEAANVVDGTAHFLRITPDPGEPDLCGGCQAEWENCPHRVRLAVTEMPRPMDAAEQQLMLIAQEAARDAVEQARNNH
jgi:hypothetical protein